MKTATYTGLNGQKFTLEYDETAPCISCGLPVWEASVGGTALCSWCDCGIDRRTGQRAWPIRRATPEEYERYRKAMLPV
jgi:hypothetical protein